MKILCDQNIPGSERAVGRLGEVVTMAGRDINREAVADADALLVRSVTRVDEDLLSGSRVRFVATATIGVDHIDREWLAKQGIEFAYAPGCNALSVAQYVAAALALLETHTGRPLADTTIAVVGVGNVGSRVARVADALGMTVLLNDPPLKRSTGDERFRELADIVPVADVVTLHVPLTRDGQDATFHLAGEELLASMKPGAVLINTSRGKVTDEQALLSAHGKLGGLVLDVFEHEPSPGDRILAACTLATPHIAGYSYDGKLRGAQMVYDALCAWAGMAPAVDLLSDIADERFSLQCTDRVRVLQDAVLGAYPLGEDVGRFMAIADVPMAQRASFFDGLRRDYPRRLEFSHYEVQAEPAWDDRLSQLGFGIAGNRPAT